MRRTPPIVLTIAGFDPGSGAGVTADIKTIAAHRCYGVACITAITVQSSQGVRRVRTLEPSLIRQTLTELADDLEIAAVKIGMLGEAEIVRAVAAFLKQRNLRKIVLDPVLRSSSGARLLDQAGQKRLIEDLLPLATVVTPNLDEAAVLTGLRVTNRKDMPGAAARLHALGAKAVVITGGHLSTATDFLSVRQQGRIEQETFSSRRLRSSCTHGTGCAFSTALACHLARGRSLRKAVRLAKSYLSGAVRSAYAVGKGVGPVNHLYRANWDVR